jgi:hypothetical protein
MRDHPRFQVVPSESSSGSIRLYPPEILIEPTWIMGVSVGPGLITFARMPRLANSAVQLRTKETKAAFVAEYAP